MKQFVLSSLILLLSVLSHGQNRLYNFHEVETRPEYPGGQDALVADITTAFHLTEEFKKDAEDGKVFIRFTLIETGEIQNLQILKGADNELDHAATDALSKIKPFRPATVHGNPVRCEMVLPMFIRFD